MATTTQPITIIGRRQSTSFSTTDDTTGQSTTILVFDITTQEVHSLENEVTDHPVEEGSNIADHSRPKPERLTLDCLVSDSPVTIEQVNQAKALGIAAAASADPKSPSAVFGYAVAVYRALQKLHEQPALLTVVTQVRQYDSMAIESISSPVSAATSGALRFSMTLKRVRVVKNKLTRLVVAKDSRAQQKIKQGSETTKAPEVEQSRLDAAFEAGQGKTGTDKAIAVVGAVLTGHP